MNGLGNIGFYMVDHIKRGKSGLYLETDAFRGKSEIFRGNLNNILVLTIQEQPKI